MKVSEHLPNGEKRRRIPLEEILIIEETTFKKVKQVLNREFTEEQEKIIKVLLFYLKREKEKNVYFSYKNSFDNLKTIYIHNANNNHQIGLIYRNPNNIIDSRQAFCFEKNLKLKGIGILAYIKQAIWAITEKRERVRSNPSASNLHHSARNVWQRLVEIGLADNDPQNDHNFIFKDISFLTKKDFEAIDEILNS